MFAFKKYESCRGLSIGPFGSYLVEIWFAPPKYEIKEHTHPHQNIKLIFLFGHNILFYRRKKGEFLGETFWAKFKDVGTIFTINAGDAHFFTVSSWPLLFMNIEKYINCKPTSASIDMEVSSAT